jgi:hypothetical protein
MAKGQYLSHHQQGIVRRYYDHIDTLTLSKLAELVSDLAVVDGGPMGKPAAKLWTRAKAALAKAGVEPARIDAIAGAGDVAALAALVGELSGGGSGRRGPAGPPKDSRSM